MVVVIPARDEEERIGRCLASVAVAVGRLAAMAPGVAVDVVVAADGCTDATVELALDAGARVLDLPACGVGAARALAIAASLGEDHAREVWIANTDADSRVPADWLTVQYGYAARGYGVMIGTVRPDPAEVSAELYAAWARTRVRGRPNGHVHGANLGIRADVYLEFGGFEAIPLHEDAFLVQRIRLSGTRIVPSDRCEVTTSGRADNRVHGGYGGYLHTELLARRA